MDRGLLIKKAEIHIEKKTIYSRNDYPQIGWLYIEEFK